MDNFGKVIEAALMNDGPYEVGIVCDWSYFECGRFRDKLRFKFRPEGLGDVNPGGSRTLLTLVLKGATDGVDYCKRVSM